MDWTDDLIDLLKECLEVMTPDPDTGEVVNLHKLDVDGDDPSLLGQRIRRTVRLAQEGE